MLRGLWDRPGPGIELVSPAFQDAFLTIGPPGKPCECGLHTDRRTHRHTHTPGAFRPCPQKPLGAPVSAHGLQKQLPLRGALTPGSGAGEAQGEPMRQGRGRSGSPRPREVALLPTVEAGAACHLPMGVRHPHEGVGLRGRQVGGIWGRGVLGTRHICCPWRYWGPIQAHLPPPPETPGARSGRGCPESWPNAGHWLCLEGAHRRISLRRYYNAQHILCSFEVYFRNVSFRKRKEWFVKIHCPPMACNFSRFKERLTWPRALGRRGAGSNGPEVTGGWRGRGVMAGAGISDWGEEGSGSRGGMEGVSTEQMGEKCIN